MRNKLDKDKILCLFINFLTLQSVLSQPKAALNVQKWKKEKHFFNIVQTMPLSLPLFIILITTILAEAYSQDATAPPSSISIYTNCNRTFSCGIIRNITYPFTGGDRPSHCGLPEFTLTCRANTFTEFTSNSVTYRVLQLDQTQNTMNLSRSDLYNNSCPSQFHNSTLNSTLFDDEGMENEVLNLIYGCNTSVMPLRPYNLFSCNSSGANISNAFYLIGPVPNDPILRIIYCNVSISVPILRASGERLARLDISLEEALMEGFSVNYSDPYESNCSECNRFGGQCGFDSGLGQPVCICGDRPCPFASTPPRNDSVPSQAAGSGKNKTGMNIGLSIAGAVLAGIGLGWLIFHYRQKKKQRLAAQSTETMSKDLLHPPSKSISTPPSATFTRSIPSYPSSKSDFGRSSFYFGVQVFSYSELEEATNNFDPSRELGDGGFGTVYYGVLADGRIVAVKRLYENNFKRVEQFMNEVEILTRLRHKNLVTLYGCTSKRSRELLLVYEYIPNGTVADHLHGKRSKSGLLSWAVRLNIAIETANALAYLHKSDIIHRDVKTNNILLDNDFHVKVADFGLSRLFPNDVTHVSTAPQGTPGYVDPEYYQCYQLTEKSDVYSFGVVLVELISSLQAVDTNRHRLDINLANMAVNKIQNHTLHELVDLSLGFETNSVVRRMATLVAELAFRCLQQERDMRPSMEEVLEVLRGIQSEDLNAHKVEVVDILIDDEVGPLKGSVAPSSPDSVVTDKSVSTSTPNSSG
ncbi:LEAF RUST 10 DISEASE-RESISTANCE LOCUS RECEPTOR-LIKE PROTEIN KINASE-like 1.4 isoform X1 [Olea europaea var. sylvestris]|uniref:LEAF RUST 10 DISEASE-RESISTANCE LOCUS RECEPTOR-LIKE PROTEIN KINASE-like 1.4 isoform X1 n=1 Tax=Olea europaea var. sylvestris TaxID=158386 RepID=UPI000C1CF05C|nr:LEAF RUST 10 DISEASE-RESISTANCE LOCUS RECEPTOR-LIKE PROTEIN KINASE-like 1.4 isoform X1 [Olea europaea var. sylvestris]